MSSSYKRDDKQFRAQIAKLADAGLNLHVGANCSIPRARPCNECTEETSLCSPVSKFTPEFQRCLDAINNAKTHAEVETAQQAALTQIRAEFLAPKPKGKLPEFFAGLIAWGIAGVSFVLAIKVIAFVLVKLWGIL